MRESGLDAATLPSVFTSAHGDLAINDYMCSTLASEPTLISPTKFHNSVHNAAAGYWTIATGCHEASTALTAFDASFGAGLLEAASQCQADARPVLLVAVDVEAAGALASVTESTGLLACAARALAARERAHGGGVRLVARERDDPRGADPLAGGAKPRRQCDGRRVAAARSHRDGRPGHGCRARSRCP